MPGTVDDRDLARGSVSERELEASVDRRDRDPEKLHIGVGDNPAEDTHRSNAELAIALELTREGRPLPLPQRYGRTSPASKACADARGAASVRARAFVGERSLDRRPDVPLSVFEPDAEAVVASLARCVEIADRSRALTRDRLLLDDDLAGRIQDLVVGCVDR